MNVPAILMGAALATSLSAQTSWIVTSSSPSNLQSAIDAASVGDELLVQPGTYGSISLTKGLTIRAQQPGTVFLLNNALFQLIQIPAGQQAHLVGLDAFDMWIIGAGTTTLEDCVMHDQGVVMSVAFGTVHLERCLIDQLPFVFSTQACISVTNTTLTAVDTVIRGASGAPGSVASPAMALASATLIGTGLELVGGSGISNAPAVIGDSSSQVRLSDSVVSGGTGTCAIQVEDAACDRCTLSSTCTVTSGSMLGMWADSAVVKGLPYRLNVHGQPNTFVLVFGSNQTDLTNAVELRLPFLLAAAGCFPAAALMTDAGGQTSVTWQIPAAALPPAVGVWFQGVSGATFPLSTSTLVGGMVR